MNDRSDANQIARPSGLLRVRRQVRRFWLGLLNETLPTDQRQAYAQLTQFWQPDLADNYCPRCGCSAVPEAVTDRGCSLCIRQKLRWSSVVRLGAYKPPLSHWIVSMKYRGNWSWGDWFGTRLAHAIDRQRGQRMAGDAASENEPRQDAPALLPVVCPVPMHWRRRWQRGYNQSHLIAAAAAAELHWPCAELLKRTRFTPPQVLLRPSQRRQNVGRSATPVAVDLQGRDVWLVDDVKTTGSTAELCTRLLLDAGAGAVHLAVVAVADPRSSTARTT